MGESYEGLPGVELHVHPYLVVWKAGEALRKNLALDAGNMGGFRSRNFVCVEISRRDAHSNDSGESLHSVQGWIDKSQYTDSVDRERMS